MRQSKKKYQKYDHKKIEKKWQREWKLTKAHATRDSVKGKKNEYLLVEFPYPSGNLHVGHWYAFAVPDIYARFARAKGRNVLYPIGFDAFGLPAENAAIKNGLNPRSWTQSNIAYMKKQLESMGASFDWTRAVSTVDPDYYRWTQWQFLQFFKKGLAYQKETPANWCPKDKTVLANEQVINGRCERCGTEVEQRLMLQWNLKITQYADRLIDDLAKLDWPEQIKESQRNWIGRSEGAEIDFEIKDVPVHATVFTTRADTLFGATYLVLAPEHPLIAEFKIKAHNRAEIEAYIGQAKKKTELERQESKEKTGVKIEGIEAINPASKEAIPVFIADYVLPGYGTGAIMAVPAHDERDYEFAQKFNLPIKEVVEPETGKKMPNEEFRSSIVAIVEDPRSGKFLTLNWGDKLGGTLFVGGGREGSESPEVTGLREITEETGYTSLKFVAETGRRHHHYFAYSKNVARNIEVVSLHFKLIDDTRQDINHEEDEKGKFKIEWLTADEILRRMHDENHVLAFQQLILGKIYTGSGLLKNSGIFDGTESEVARAAITEEFGRAKKMYRLRDWGVSRQRYWGVPIPIIHCPECGALPVPDKDLPVKLPEVKDYLPTGDGKSPLAKATKWVNVKCPKCKGKAKRETDTFDTFVDSSWYFIRYTDPKNKKQFADKNKQKIWMPVDLYSGGSEHTTMHVLYSRFWHKALYDLKLVSEKEPYTRRMNRGLILGPDGQKMSKSKGNVIDPDAIVAQLGGDTVRLYLAFIGPYNEPGSYPWNPDSIVGVRRFLERTWRLYVDAPISVAAVPDKDVERSLHQTIKKVEEDCAAFKFNTAIAQMMTFLNLAESKGITHEQYATFVRILAPFAPHITEELWHMLGNKKSVHQAPWPKYSKAKLLAGTITIAIQINGKTRGEVKVSANGNKEAIESTAREAVADRLTGQTITRTIVVPGRLINFVLAEI